MLYPKNAQKELDSGLFEHPTAEYRGAPFWAWNCALDKTRLSKQIEMMQAMGFGGFHMHVRTGMSTPYLSPEFMDFVRYCTEQAKARGMLAYLYDEDRWPSGAAGGRITAKHPEYAKKQMLFTPVPYPKEPVKYEKGSVPGRGGCGRRYENGRLLAAYDICLDENGLLGSFRFLRPEDKDAPNEDGAVRWYGYLESAEDDPWFNDHPYVDTLNPDAVRAFLQETHEAYAREVGGEFGGVIPAIFTDEPQYTHRGFLGFPFDRKDAFIAWTDTLEKEYKKLYGQDLLPLLPLLFWESADEKAYKVRWQYQNLLAELFRDHYCRQIGVWCDAHGIALTGHVNGEETLHTQTVNVGDAMRCYPEFGIPGIDMLCDSHQYNNAKQAQSIVRQEGKPAMLSELYGVTGWDYDFRGYKLQGDWQAALGVTLRVPHLTWMSMKGEAKRDYPASIGYQSPWWDQFSLIEDHFARLNTVLTRGRAVCDVAVVHPVESYWLLCGPSAQTAAVRKQMEDRFEKLTETLLFGQIDFDFLSESCLPKQVRPDDPLRVGQMTYRTVIVPGCVTLRRSTLAFLEAFKRAGGKLIFLGECPAYVDAEKSAEANSLFRESMQVPFEADAILEALEEDRRISVHLANGKRAENLLYQLREDNGTQWLFLTNGKNPESPDVDDAPVYRVSLRGTYALTEYDTLTGRISPFPAELREGNTVFSLPWHIHTSLLLRMEKASGLPENAQPAPEEKTARPAEGPALLRPVSYTLEEPNMLLLDMAEWALDGGPLHPLEEVLRLDNQARDLLALPRRRKAVVQPYLLPSERPKHTLYLRFTVPSETEIESVSLAMEEPEQARIVWNGSPVERKTENWFVDEDIRVLPLGKLRRGVNLLEAWLPIGRQTNLECFYLLGAFGVRIAGVEKTVIPLPETLGFGDVVPQGMPFYTGNLQYHFDLDVPGDSLILRAPHYRGALIRVIVDGEDRGPIIFSPYQLTVKNLQPGVHAVTLRLFGNRQNGFGQLHHTQSVYFYQSPDSWRSTGDRWRYEYQFKPLGILKGPGILLP